jgi:hypothetical protein
MGADLPARPAGGGAPSLVVAAWADAGNEAAPGRPLQRIQIIKGWVDPDGTERERVYEVAGDPDNGAAVDPATCETSGEGFDRLCTVWTDPDFAPDRPAFYYARVLENPSCRWTAYDCRSFGAAERPAACSDPAVPQVQQERAWTSAVWYAAP